MFHKRPQKVWVELTQQILLELWNIKSAVHKLQVSNFFLKMQKKKEKKKKGNVLVSYQYWPQKEGN